MNRIQSDDGFMGRTHALSAIALFLSVVAFAPEIVTVLFPNHKVEGLISCFLLMVGAALLPDFDNVRSTVISVLGVVGQLISTLMRAFATFIYSITRSKYDKPNADPHRGFWHTAVAGISVGFLGYVIVSSLSHVKVSFVPISLGHVFLWVFIAISTQVFFAIFLKKQFKKLKSKGIAPLVSWILGGMIATYLVFALRDMTNFKWIWIAISSGWIIHILGDTITTSGTPILFPIKRKGHRWWTWRLPPHIKADGPTEHYLIEPLFILISVVSIIIIFTNGF